MGIGLFRVPVSTPVRNIYIYSVYITLYIYNRVLVSTPGVRVRDEGQG